MIAAALQRLRPNASWSLNGDSYDGLVWHDQDTVPPTLQEVQQVVAVIKQERQATEYQRLRARAYPPITDYLDAVVKNDQQQLQQYIDACLQVKERFPKPKE